MATTYRTRKGDTFATISRRQYGTEEKADLIARANPGVVEPLTGGLSLTTPDAPDAPADRRQQAPADRLNEVAIAIDGERFRFWDSVRITRAIDSLDTVEFGAPFDSTAPGYRETFRPFSYKPLEVTVAGEPLFSGTQVSITPVLENEQRTLTIGGYSLPGVLNDCTQPVSAFPLEYNGQGLQEIARTVALPFGLAVQFDADPGAVFDRVACPPARRALVFLADLAKQRNLVIGSTPSGKLLFQQATDPGNPVARLQQGSAPLLSVAPFFSPQDYYSHVTGLDNVVVGYRGSRFTVKNDRLEGVVRPFTFHSPNVIDADLKASVEAKTGRMFASMAAYAARVATWRDPTGNLWAPNTTLTLQAPDAMIYQPYEFLIRSVEFERDDKTETATLNLVFPGAFKGQQPETLPWDE